MSDDDRIVETFTELAPRYEAVIDTELSRFWGWRYTDFADYLIKMTPCHPGDRILDVATGTAVIPRKIHDTKKPLYPVHGLDITHAMLRRAQNAIAHRHSPDHFCLTCASGMAMPYRDEYFDVVLCGLATHHMEARTMLAEMYRVLKPDGELSISDVGGSPWWRIPGLKFVIKLFAFFYYLIEENPTRAWAEAQGVSNIRNVDQWYGMLQEQGFEYIRITRLKSKYSWIPKPMLIRASKNNSGG